MKNKRKYIKTRNILKKTRINKKNRMLLKSTKKQVNKVNAKIKSLERRFKTKTWATKKLADRLDTEKVSVFKNNRIKINDNLTTTQLIQINKATRQFLESKTSTKKGIKDVASATKQSIKESLEYEDIELDDDELNFMYDMLGDDDFSYFNKSREDTSFIGASELWVVIDEAIRHNYDENSFLNMMNVFVNVNDEDIRTKAKNIYYKYVV